MQCPWDQFCSDLVIAVVGSSIAVLGALLIAPATSGNGLSLGIVRGAALNLAIPAM